jgi:hypothetical protein
MKAADSQPNTITRDDAGDAATPVTLTAAQRQRAYRLRRRRAVIDAIGQEDTASRVALLTLLGHDLAALEARTAPEHMMQALRNSARRVLNAIVTRYGIEL